MNIVTITAGFLVAISLVTPLGRAESFDKPLHTKVLDLGRSQNLMPNDDRHVTVTCWYYSHFMVKQKDDPGLKGAVLIALAPIQRGHSPKCLQGLQPGEKEFRQWNAEYKEFDGWNGYFAGVKRDLVFLTWPDGNVDGGLPFTVFKSNARTKVFADSVQLLDRGKTELNFLQASGNQVILRYLRVTSAECSIPESGKRCWSRLQQKSGLIKRINAQMHLRR